MPFEKRWTGGCEKNEKGGNDKEEPSNNFLFNKFLLGDSRAGRTRHFGESELRMDRGLEMFVSGRLPLVPGDGVLGRRRPHDAAHEKGHPDRRGGQVLSRRVCILLVFLDSSSRISAYVGLRPQGFETR